MNAYSAIYQAKRMCKREGSPGAPATYLVNPTPAVTQRRYQKFPKSEPVVALSRIGQVCNAAFGLRIDTARARIDKSTKSEGQLRFHKVTATIDQRENKSKDANEKRNETLRLLPAPAIWLRFMQSICEADAGSSDGRVCVGRRGEVLSDEEVSYSGRLNEAMFHSGSSNTAISADSRGHDLLKI
jgi:hypothetical protein